MQGIHQNNGKIPLLFCWYLRWKTWSLVLWHFYSGSLVFSFHIYRCKRCIWLWIASTHPAWRCVKFRKKDQHKQRKPGVNGMWWDHEEERSYFSPTSQVLVDSLFMMCTWKVSLCCTKWRQTDRHSVFHGGVEMWITSILLLDDVKDSMKSVFTCS